VIASLQDIKKSEFEFLEMNRSGQVSQSVDWPMMLDDWAMSEHIFPRSEGTLAYNREDSISTNPDSIETFGAGAYTDSPDKLEENENDIMRMTIASNCSTFI
jgi:hypothetical protein